jgi:multiple sugar transport system permease protein
MAIERDTPPPAEANVSAEFHIRGSRAERWAGAVLIWPAVLIVLFLAIVPLLISIYFSLSRFQLVKGGFQLTFVGLLNYRKLLFGSEQEHFLGKLAAPSPLGWMALALVGVVLVYGLWRYARGPTCTAGGLCWRIVGALFAGWLAWIVVRGLSPGGRPGTLVVTLLYVTVGVSAQYLLGLGLALLCAQRLPGRRFFRVVFLLPMMITPVGVAYMFRMMTDTTKGPLAPLWNAAGLASYSWVNNPWGARTAVVLADIWQWTPFMFIVLLAAIEGLPVEPVEAAHVDGASRWQIFRYVMLPALLPVSTTLILIRTIEAFKIVDLPRVMTNGGPGTATESLTLHAFQAWRALDLGGSAAVAFMLLIVVTLVCIALVQLVRRHTTEAV